MNLLTKDRRLVLYDQDGDAYCPVRDGGTGRSIFKIKPEGASNRADDAIHTEDWLGVARAMLVDGLAARCKAVSGGPVNYLKYGAQKLVRYELDPEIAQALGIPPQGDIDQPATDLSRVAVEAAMDAFDENQSTGAYAELFNGFGNPRDYWVRSTRERKDRDHPTKPPVDTAKSKIYPTKPIVGYILQTTNINGGWSQKASAATQLYNAGYVIVDRDNTPSMPPDGNGHLIAAPDRIRLCALNYYIEPARESHETEVPIHIGNFAKEMGLQDAHLTICQALGGEEFQKLAKVSPPSYTEPNPSPSTTFTFKLARQAEAIPVTEETKAKATEATNLILYGPPGTGKTYHTALEAVRLCLGDDVAKSLSGNDKRKALMTEYRRLAESGRIEFVTFHQSMSYEEFVEGLRPSTGDDDGDGPEDGRVSTGFRLKPHDGVFKRACARAERDVGEIDGANRLHRKPRIIRIGLTGSNWREKFDRAIREGCVDWPHGGDTDWSPPEFDSWEAIKAARQVHVPEILGNHPTVYGTSLFRDASVGEYIALTVGKSKIVALGQFKGGYTYEPAAENAQQISAQSTSARHYREVNWLWHSAEGVDRNGIYGKDFTSFHTAYPIPEDQLNWDALDHLAFGSKIPPRTEVARPYVLIIDEINRANISKVFGELITLLEPDKRVGIPNEIQVTLPYSKKKFGVPANLHIIGTMNTADRSIALLDTALRRRFTFRELMPDPDVLPTDVEGINLQSLLRTLNERIEYLFDRDHQIGHAYFTSCETREGVESVMRHKVIPLLAEYFYDDWSKVAAVLGDVGQTNGCFLVSEDGTKAPKGLESESFSSPRPRWRVKPPQDGNGNGGFDFSGLGA